MAKFAALSNVVGPLILLYFYNSDFYPNHHCIVYIQEPAEMLRLCVQCLYWWGSEGQSRRWCVCDASEREENVFDDVLERRLEHDCRLGKSPRSADATLLMCVTCRMRPRCIARRAQRVAQLLSGELPLAQARLHEISRANRRRTAYTYNAMIARARGAAFFCCCAVIKRSKYT